MDNATFTLSSSPLPRALALLTAFVFSLASASAQIVVNSTGDESNGYPPGFGNCDTNAFDNVIVCTLRAAIEVANGNPNVSTITFDIPTTDPGYNAQAHSWMINLGSALPDLSTNMNINGPGASKLTVRLSAGAFRIFNVTTADRISISALTIANGNVAGPGGGIQNAGGANITLSKCTIRNNYGSTGGAVFNSSSGTLAIDSSTLNDSESQAGGAIDNAGKLTITGSTVRRNLAIFQGGGLNNSGDATLAHSTVADNRVIYNQEVSNTVVFGGGIYSAGTLSLTNCAVSGNSARGEDADRFEPTDAGHARGGGIFSRDSALTIINSTVFGNSAEGGNFGGGGGALGGGIYYVGQGTLNLSNSTVAGNSAVGGYDRSGGTGSFGGGVLTASPSIVNVKSPIIATNSADSAPTGLGSSPDVYGPFKSKGSNLIGKKDGSTGFTAATDKKGTIKAPLDPKLGQLQNNGGPTQTMALLTGSPAIDQGTSVTIAGTTLTTDQRGTGFPRVHDNGAIANAAGGNGTDIGAFELQTP